MHGVLMKSEMLAGITVPKVLAVSSGGGHWIQLMRISPAFDGMDVVYASTQEEGALGVEFEKYYKLRDATRFNKRSIAIVTFQAFRMLLKERPDVVVTTGALPGLITLILARALFGSRTIWIDSIANCEVLSTSGRIAKRFSSLWLTQWVHVSSDRGPHFWGSVL